MGLELHLSIPKTILIGVVAMADEYIVGFDRCGGLCIACRLRSLNTTRKDRI